MTPTSPYDALLLVSFGGPESPDDVVPFLENVTRGRGIPRERLEEVGRALLPASAAVSPINDQNRALLAALARGPRGARHRPAGLLGQPQLGPLPRRHAARRCGRRRHAGPRACVTSAYSSYSGCRQYRENLADAVDAVGEGAPRLDRLRHYFNHPGFVEPMVDATLAALAELPDDVRATARTWSSSPTRSRPPMNDAQRARRAAPTSPSTAASPTASSSGSRAGDRPPAPRASWCSARGPGRRTCRGSSPTSTTTSRSCAADGVAGGGDGADRVRLRPHGGHLRPRHRGAGDRRASSGCRSPGPPPPGVDPRFVAMVRDLLLERAAVERGEEPCAGPRRRARAAPWDVCPAGCCPNAARPQRPALCGARRDRP